MSTIGAPGRPPNAISGAPAGTATGSGAPAPAGTGAPAGNGSPPGTGAPAGTGAPTGSGAATGSTRHVGDWAPAGAHAAPAAPRRTGCSGSCRRSGFACRPCMHAPPPVFNGAAAASGLSAIAAPHSPMPATTLMLNRSKAVIDVNSLSRSGISRTKMQPHARSHSGSLSANSFLIDRCSTCTTPHHDCCQIVTYSSGLLDCEHNYRRRAFELSAPNHHTDQAKPAPALDV